MSRSRTIVTIAIKDLRLICRDRSGMFFTFVFPLAFAIFFGIIFSGSGKEARTIAVVIFDEDKTERSRAFAASLLSASEFRASTAESTESARAAVLHRKAVAAVTIPKGFGGKQGAVLGGTAPELQLGIDPSRTAETGMLMGVLQKYAFMGMASTFNDPAAARLQLKNARTASMLSGTKIDPRVDKLFADLEVAFAGAEASGLSGNAAEDAAALEKTLDAKKGAAPKVSAAQSGGFSPITITTHEVQAKRIGPPNSFAFSFPQGVVWGVMGAALGFGSSLLSERQSGTLARLRCSPLSVTHILLGKALACFVTIISVISLLLLMAAIGFGVQFAEPLSLAMAVISVGICFVGIMMLVAALSPSERGATGLAWGIMMLFAFLGGAAVPLFAMPNWMQQVSDVSPMKWTVVAIEGGVWRGTEPIGMLLPCAILLAVGLIGFFGGAAAFARKPAA